MPLRLTLKPDEKAIIGGAAIQNGSKSTSFTITNDTVILREKDVLTEETAGTPAKRIYLIIQMMYLSGGLEQSKEFHGEFFNLTNDFLAACPTETALLLINDIGQSMLGGNFYKALKKCKELIKYEKSILEPELNTDEQAEHSESSES